MIVSDHHIFGGLSLNVTIEGISLLVSEQNVSLMLKHFQGYCKKKVDRLKESEYYKWLPPL